MHRRIAVLSLVVVASALLVASPVLAAPNGPQSNATAPSGVVSDTAEPTLTTSGSPSLNLTVGSTHVGEGDLYKTGHDPELTINASVGATAPAERTLTEVVVRVNGDLQRNISVDGDVYNGTIRLELDAGKNRVRVIATDDEDRANSTTFTVNKDINAPYVQLDHPYWTAPYLSIRDGFTNGSWTMLNGTLFDASEVRELYVLHSWEAADDSDDVVDYETGFRLDYPSRNFSERIFLGDNGTNVVELTATDRFGNTRLMQFEVGVNDTESPSIRLDPSPNRTARKRLFISGTVADDVWVDEATVTVRFLDGQYHRKRHIFRPREYTIDPSRTEKPFNKSFNLEEPGTYRVTVTARDHLNKTTQRTFRIERLPADEFTIAPEIRVVRSRTVVLDEETLFLDAIVFDGQTERVVVETRNVTTGRSIAYHFIYSGKPKKRIDFDRKVTIGPGRTEVIVRAIDANGVEHERSFFVNGTSRETFVGNGSDSGLSVSLRPLPSDETGAASASITVAGARGGTRLSIPGERGPHAIAETSAVSLQRLDVELLVNANFTMNVTMRDGRAGPLAAPPNTTAVATTTIDHSISNERIGGVTLRVDVRKSYLADRGVDPANLTVYRRSNGEWSRVSTSRLDDNSTHARYRVDSPGLSVYAFAVPTTATDESSADDTPTDDTGTPTDDSEQQTDGSSDDSSNDQSQEATEPEQKGSPRIVVSNVTVNATSVTPGSVVAVNATLENSGNADGTYVAVLRIFEGTNFTLVDRTTVSVPAGTNVTTTLTHRFNETGTYNVSVNGTRAGPVAVTGGGLLSIFSFVPIGLIGMGLAGLVGLGVVGVLVRFVLRRIGGEASE